MFAQRLLEEREAAVFQQCDACNVGGVVAAKIERCGNRFLWCSIAAHGNVGKEHLVSFLVKAGSFRDPSHACSGSNGIDPDAVRRHFYGGELRELADAALACGVGSGIGRDDEGRAGAGVDHGSL